MALDYKGLLGLRGGAPSIAQTFAQSMAQMDRQSAQQAQQEQNQQVLGLKKDILEFQKFKHAQSVAELKEQRAQEAAFQREYNAAIQQGPLTPERITGLYFKYPRMQKMMAKGVERMDKEAQKKALMDNIKLYGYANAKDSPQILEQFLEEKKMIGERTGNQKLVDDMSTMLKLSRTEAGRKSLAEMALLRGMAIDREKFATGFKAISEGRVGLEMVGVNKEKAKSIAEKNRADAAKARLETKQLELELKGAKGGVYMSKQEELKSRLTSQYEKEYLAMPGVKAAQEIEFKMRSALNAPKTAAGDTARIQFFSKVLDPGVTRDPEFDRIIGLGGVGRKMFNQIKKALGSDEALGDTERKRLDEALAKIYQSAQQSTARYKKSINERAQRYRVPLPSYLALPGTETLTGKPVGGASGGLGLAPSPAAGPLKKRKSVIVGEPSKPSKSGMSAEDARKALGL